MRTMSTLLERLDWVIRERKISARSWSMSAGQSGGYLGNLRTTLRRLKPGEPEPDPGAATIRRLAAVARVSEHWLATGGGSPDVPAASALREMPGWDAALEEAQRERDRERWPPGDYLDRAGDAVVPGRTPSSRLILSLAELLWRTDPERVEDPAVDRETAPPITQESPIGPEADAAPGRRMRNGNT